MFEFEAEADIIGTIFDVDDRRRDGEDVDKSVNKGQSKAKGQGLVCFANARCCRLCSPPAAGQAPAAVCQLLRASWERANRS